MATVGILGDVTGASGTSVTLFPFGFINATWPTASFDLKSFYFGCLLSTALAPLQGVPVTCEIQLFAWDVTGAEMASATYIAAAPGDPLLEKETMQLVTLPGNFKNLTSVELMIVITGAGIALNPRVTLSLDDVCHVNHLG